MMKRQIMRHIKGLLASWGVAFCFESAIHALKPATAIGVIGASAPPAIAISISPCKIISYALPIASAPD